MSNVINVVSKIFEKIFVYRSGALFNYLIYAIRSQPYLIIGTVFLIIGFSIGLIKRIIHS